MLLTGWTKEITRVACRPEARTLLCIARLNEDIGAAIPYLNAVLGGYTYIKEPPSVTFRSQGKLITVHSDHIAINANRDPDEAEKILQWLQREINEAWERRDRITPSYEAAPRPQVFEILRLLPRPTAASAAGRPVSSLPPWPWRAARAPMTALSWRRTGKKSCGSTWPAFVSIGHRGGRIENAGKAAARGKICYL